MYAIRTTPGLIIDSRTYGEAGKMLSIFTRDLGLITATAAGIRFEKSKLRYHTQDYSMGVFSFVHGKEFWRLTSADAPEKDGHSRDTPSAPAGAAAGSRSPSLAPKRLSNQPSFSGASLPARLALLLRRLLQGEEPHPELFECLESCLTFLNASQAMNGEEARALESIAVLRMLHALRYIGADPLLAAYSGSSAITPELLKQAIPQRTLINQHINKALRESHL